MRIDRGSVVTLAYELRNADGEPLEEEGARLAYLHGGYGGIFPRVEEALQGTEVGHELSLTLDPEDAFGDYDPDLLRVEPRDRFPLARGAAVCENPDYEAWPVVLHVLTCVVIIY